MTPGVPAVAADRLGVRRMAGARGFRRVLASRFAAQWGDGVFQAGLGGALLFNPEREADPIAIAVGLAVLLLPYSLVGPFAGALLDRWDRRRVLVVANLLRGAVVVGVAAGVAAGVAGAPLYLGALLVTGTSRFVLSGLSAGLPHVVAERHLVEANALAATAGAGVAVAGSACAIALSGLLGAGDTGSALVTGGAVVGSLVAAGVIAGFPPGRLGPDRAAGPPEVTRAAAGGFRDGLRAVRRARGVAAGLVALGAHRVAFGVATLSTLLLYRALPSDGWLRGGPAGLGQALAAGALGLLAAAVLTPVLVARLGRRRTVRGALVVAAAVLLVLGLPMTLATLLAATFGLAAAGQVVKLSLDAAVQTDIGDAARGRVFSLYDAVSNTGYVLAVALAALVVPADGRAPGLLVAAAGIYLAAAVAHVLVDPA